MPPYPSSLQASPVVRYESAASSIRTPVKPTGKSYAKTASLPSNKSQRTQPNLPTTIEKTQFFRIPQGTSIKVEKGEILRVLNAVYRVEGGLGDGVERDVTDLIANLVEKADGGLIVTADNKGMGITKDPYPDRKKVLVITYVPRKGGVAVQLASPVGERDKNAQFVRIPEHSRITIPAGTIQQLLTADYRVEGSGKIGLQKDVFGIVKRGIRAGGLDMWVNYETMELRNDPYPEKEKVLVISYTPLPEPTEQLLEIREGGWLEIPEGTIARLMEADLRLPFHEEAGHGYSVDLYNRVLAMIEDGGISGRYITKKLLGIDYDPFDDHTKVLRILYMPHRYQPRRPDTTNVDDVLGSAERILNSNLQGYRCTATRPTVFQNEVGTARSLIEKVRAGGGWGDDKLAMADSLLHDMVHEAQTSQTRVLIDKYRSGQISKGGGGRSKGASQLSELSFKDVSALRGGTTHGTSYPVPEVPDAGLHPAAAYHVGSPLGKIPVERRRPAHSGGGPPGYSEGGGEHLRISPKRMWRQ